MIVVDTNVLAYLYLPGEHTAAAETLLQQDLGWRLTSGAANSATYWQDSCVMTS